MDVINRGYSGYNTDWIIPVFEQVRGPDYVASVISTVADGRINLLPTDIRHSARTAARTEGSPARDLVWRQRCGSAAKATACPSRAVQGESVQTHLDGLLSRIAQVLR